MHCRSKPGGSAFNFNNHTLMTFSRILATLVGFSLLLLSGTGAQAREDRNLLQNTYSSIQDKKETFVPGKRWMPFPEYGDRAGWDKLTGRHKAKLIRSGEKILGQDWELITASEYLEFEKDGKVSHTYATKRNFGKIATLTLAELAEGKGRFLPKLMDGLWYMAERHSWQSPFHAKGRGGVRCLPDSDRRFISLNSADAASRIAEAVYFFREEFDKIDPVFTKTIIAALDRNIFTPYLDDSQNIKGHSWMGYNRKKGQTVNNWNTYCNMQCLMAFLLCEPDPERLLRAIEKCCFSMDQYLECVELDGACNEGPSYWNMAGAKVYDFAKMMIYASDGKFNILGDDQVKRLLRYKADNYIGDGWVINFADGLARDGGDKCLPFRMGIDTACPDLVNFSLLLCAGKDKFDNTPKGTSTFRTLESLIYMPQLEEKEKAILEQAGGNFAEAKAILTKSLGSSWYPDTQIATLRNGEGWTAGLKAGHNKESHNHNDVGSAILFIDDCPVFIDMGCGVYSSKTFSKERYTLDENRSDWHNLPTINGVQQKDGIEFRSKETLCNIEEGIFSTDISEAYPTEAACEKWVREYKLSKTSLTVTDEFSLKERKAADDVHFVTNGKVTIKGSYVLIDIKSYDGAKSHTVKLGYPKALKAYTEDKTITDERHLRSWGDRVTRIVFKSSEKAPLKGKYTFTTTLVK